LVVQTYTDFLIRAETVRARIVEVCQRCGRHSSEVTLLAVTKTYPASAAEYAFRFGLAAVGENRVQEAAEKKPLAPTGLSWELVGHLQSNKARLAAATFDRVQSVDSEKLLSHLDRAACELGKTLPILLQINAGNDPAKFGAEPGDAPRLLETALTKKNLRVDGLMTIAPLSPDSAVAVRTFQNLRAIRDELSTKFSTPLRELSMGMSGDFDAAIAAGSTLVRVGSALFGAR
jgi:hypothetical protein